MASVNLEELGLMPERLPTHVAVIMDGNGRWATAQGLPRVAGHLAGADTALDISRFCGDLSIKYLTLYAFSTENWRRPADEVEAILRLISSRLLELREEFHAQEARFRHLGDRSELPDFMLEAIDTLEAETDHHRRVQLNLAINYGSRRELLYACKELARQVRAGQLEPEAIDEEVFSKALYTGDIPDPELMVRTSGELRVSNYLLWQIAYSELYVSEVYWPDFTRDEFLKALRDYQSRNRRFGGV